MVEPGRVVALQEATVWIETDRQSTCGSCSARKGCGTTLLNSLRPERNNLLEVLASRSELEGLHIGDTVEISIPDDVVLQASFVVYLLPLLLMLGGAMLGEQLMVGDAMAATGGILGLLAGGGLIKLYSHLHRHNRRMQPSLVRRLMPATEIKSVAAIL